MMAVRTLAFGQYQSPIGEINVAVLDGALAWLDFADNREREAKLLTRYYGRHKRVPADNPHGFGDCLKAYFDGDLAAFDGMNLAAVGTEFQRRVWAALRKVRPGQVASYVDIAKRLDKPLNARAVGQANANNPFALVVPCHRIIAKGGGLGGYAGGLKRKDWLLKHEGAAEHLRRMNNE